MRLTCRNSRCGDRLFGSGEWLGFCPACTLIGRRAFALGAFAAGLLAWLIKVGTG